MIIETEQFVKQRLKNDVSGHDWHHIDRVRKACLYICKQEKKGNPFIIEMAALLHDIADVKLNASKEKGLRDLDNFLQTQRITAEDKQHILAVIESVSFNGGHGISPITIEAKIVQDGDSWMQLGQLALLELLLMEEVRDK